jgi:hypothetical protein
MTTATATTIDLRGLYARECAAHVLVGEVVSIAASLAGGEGSLSNDEPPAVDRMIVEGFSEILDPYVARLKRLAAITTALEVVANPNSASVEWPSGCTDAILKTSNPARLLCESMGMWPEDRLEELAAAIGPARAFTASLPRREVTDRGGDA